MPQQEASRCHRLHNPPPPPCSASPSSRCPPPPVRNVPRRRCARVPGRRAAAVRAPPPPPPPPCSSLTLAQVLVEDGVVDPVAEQEKCAALYLPALPTPLTPPPPPPRMLAQRAAQETAAKRAAANEVRPPFAAAPHVKKSFITILPFNFPGLPPCCRFEGVFHVLSFRRRRRS
jgi:hypothetical protein